MLYKFEDINSEDMYNSCRVMFVTGKYNIFSNIVIDKLKKLTDPEQVEYAPELLEEFGITAEEIVKVSNSVNLDTFINVINTPNFNGKWFCSVNLGFLTKKQNEWLKEYIKNPSENGILVLESTEYKHYKFWLNSKLIKIDKHVHLIQLSFPRRDSLRIIVTNLFLDRHARIEERALDLFIFRMSSAYDDYIQIIDKICDQSLPEDLSNLDILDLPVLTYEQVFDALRGIENFVIEDFITQLTIPPTLSKKGRGSIIYKMLGYLLDEYGPRKLVNTLSSRIDELIEFRIAINTGYIPIIVNYNVNEAKTLIGESSSISKKSDYQFKKLASVASKTSLEDWLYMKMTLLNVNKMDENSYYRALFSLVSRSMLTDSRLQNDILGEKSILGDIDYIDNISKSLLMTTK